MPGIFYNGFFPRVYDVALDDQSFLTTRPVDTETGATSVILVLNFLEELKRLVPTEYAVSRPSGCLD